MTNTASSTRRIKHVPKINRENRHDDHPRRYVLAEKIKPDHLAGPGIDDGAHEHRFRERQSVIDSKRTEQQAKGRSGNDKRKSAPDTVNNIGAR